MDAKGKEENLFLNSAQQPTCHNYLAGPASPMLEAICLQRQPQAPLNHLGN